MFGCLVQNTSSHSAALQLALGYFQNFNDNTYATSIETYYKDLDNQIDYRENYVNNAADDLETEFVFGEGRAYGVELFVNKRKGDLTGWIGYTSVANGASIP